MARSRLPTRWADLLCLDFVNTVDYHATDQPVEYLVDAGVLVDWAVDAGAVDAELAGGIRAWVDRHRERAEHAVADLLARREALYRVLLAQLPSSHHRPASDRDLRLVASWVADARGHAVLVPDRPRWRWDWPAEMTLRRTWWPVAASAGDLLTGGELERLGICDNPGCGGLFLDTSKNHSRRWCSMAICGNAIKSRRHAARVRASRNR
jgi:predicted RNA-binding Zn ribbon-like protein